MGVLVYVCVDAASPVAHVAALENEHAIAATRFLGHAIPRFKRSGVGPDQVMIDSRSPHG